MRSRLHQMRSADSVFHGTTMPETTEGQAASGLLRKRSHWLEKQFVELQHDLRVAEQFNDGLRAQFNKATGGEPR